MKIKVENLDKEFQTSGEDILKDFLENSVKINNFCNGKGTCGKCKIKILSGIVSPPSEQEKLLLSQEEIKENIRLACQIFPETDIEIRNFYQNSKLEILDQGEIPDFKKFFRSGYGFAIDIGTTTIALYLVDLSTGEIVGKISDINPQSKYGLDVMTRISFEYENPKGKDLLKEVLIKSLKELLHRLIKDYDIEKNSIKEIIVAANTTMLHMLVGADAKKLGRFPYEAEFLQGQKFCARDLDIDFPANLYTLANVSAFIGSDIVAGVYLTKLKEKENTLFIDIGTNGEMVLKTRNKLYACSTAAGPALEAMNISSGMRAERGAIEEIKIEKDQIRLKIIGGKKAKGICGSGLLSAVAEAIENKLINKRGRIIDPKNLENSDFRKKYIRENENGKRFIILDKENKIYLSQDDIRAVQLAKGAILSGFLTLLQIEKVDIEKLNSVIIAGAFGSHLKKSDISKVGILPKEVENLITYVGNSSLVGAYMALMNPQIKNEMEDLAKEISYVELSTSKDYEKTFARAMQF